VQRNVVPVEPKSTTVYDAGFTMIAMIPKYKLTVWSIYMMFDDNYVRHMCACVWIQLYYNQKLN
jgi:hypothetical protein